MSTTPPDTGVTLRTQLDAAIVESDSHMGRALVPYLFLRDLRDHLDTVEARVDWLEAELAQVREALIGDHTEGIMDEFRDLPDAAQQWVGWARQQQAELALVNTELKRIGDALTGFLASEDADDLPHAVVLLMGEIRARAAGLP